MRLNFRHYIPLFFRLFPAASFDPTGRAGHRKPQGSADAVHVGRRFRRERVAPFRARVAHDRALAGGEGGPDPFRRHPLPLPQRDPAGQVAHAGERHVGDGDMRLHPVGLPMEHRPHLEIVLGDPEALLDPPEFAAAVEQFGMAHVGRVGHDAFRPVPAGGLLDLRLVDFQPGFSRELDEPAETASGERLSGIGASAELADQLVDRLLPVGGVLFRPLPAPADDDAASLVLELSRKQALGAADGIVGAEVEDLLLQVLRQRFQPGADDILEIPLLHVLEVRLAEHPPVGDVDRGLDPFALPHVLQRRDQALAFILRSGEHLVADRQPVGRGHKRKQDLGPTMTAVLGEAELAQPVRIDRLEVQRRAVEEDDARRLRKQPPRRPGREILHAFDRFPVQPVHHPVDPLHRDRNSEIALQPPGGAELAFGIGDARRHDVPQRLARRAVPLGRQQLVEAKLAVDGSAGLMEAGHDPALLAGLLDHHRRTRLRLLPPGLDRQIDELLLRKQGGLPLAPDADLDGLAELHELLQLGVGLGDADVADDALADRLAFAHGFDELDGLVGASGLGFDAEKHGAIPDSLFCEPLPRTPRFCNIGSYWSTTNRPRAQQSRNPLARNAPESRNGAEIESNCRSQEIYASIDSTLKNEFAACRQFQDLPVRMSQGWTSSSVSRPTNEGKLIASDPATRNVMPGPNIL